MGLKVFEIDFDKIANINSLFLTTRIKKYNLKFSSDDIILSYFLDNKYKFTLGKIKREDYQTNGKFPIIDQGQEFIAGYSDEDDLVYSGDLPVIVFGDHTRTFKYVDFRFIQGADGIKIIRPKESIVNPKFFYYLLSKICVPSRGYNRHFSILMKQKYPLISKSKQDQIVAQIEPIEKNIKELKAQIKEPQEIINKVFAREFGFDENLFNEFGKGMTAGTQIAQNRTLRVFETDFEELSRSGIVRFSTRFHNPPTKKLMDFLDSIETAQVKNILLEPIHRGASPSYDSNGEIPVVKTGHLKNGYIEISQEEFVDTDFYKKSIRSQVKQGDILIASTGKISLGKIDLLEEEQNLVADGHVSIVRIDDKKYSRQFFTYYFRSVLGYFQIERDFTGATNQIELYADEISNFQIPNISLKDQQKIVDEIKAELDKQEEIKSKIENERNKIDEIIENSIKNN